MCQKMCRYIKDYYIYKIKGDRFLFTMDNTWVNCNEKNVQTDEIDDNLSDSYSDCDNGYCMNENSNYSKTENDCVAYKSTGIVLLDLFIRSNRDISENELLKMFNELYKEDKKIAIGFMFYLRDIRKGKGEKKITYHLCRYLRDNDFVLYKKNIRILVEKYGYYKDYLNIIENGKYYSKFAKKLNIEDIIEAYPEYDNMVKKMIEEKDKLIYKWLPTEKSHYDKKIKSCFFIKKIYGHYSGKEITSKIYRNLLCENREQLNVLERNMCTKKWDNIVFEHVPSRAMLLNKKVFERHDETKERFLKYLTDVKNGKTKINANCVNPHELISEYMKGDELSLTVEQQWKAIVDDIKKNNTFEDTLAIVDVSGSMNGLPMQVAIALGLIIAELNTVNQNNIITFSEKPSFFKIEGESLKEKVTQVLSMPWGMNTNLDEVFDLLFSLDSMPSTLFIFTDMQFDAAIGCRYSNNDKNTFFETIKNKCIDKNIVFPKIICWNLRASISAFPFNYEERDVLMLSGYSQTLFKLISECKNFNPLDFVMDILEKYSEDVILE